MSDAAGRALVAVTVLAALLLVGAGGGPVGHATAAHGNDTADTTPPSMVGGAPANATAMTVRFTDNHDVNETTIDRSDFQLTDGNLTGVAVAENGSNATVTLHIAEPLNTDDVTVALASGAVVADTNGNAIDTSDIVAVEVSGMDTVPPGVYEFSATDATNGTAHVRLSATEPLAGINVTVTGPGPPTRLTEEDFVRTGPYVYETDYLPETDGRYELSLETVTDEAGNVADPFESATVLADNTPPDANIGIDVSASGGRTYTFVARSPDAVANYTWLFGDGTAANGSRVTHRFQPGNYTVVLRASDQYGNVGTDRLPLRLTNATGGNVSGVGPAVTVDRHGGTAMVHVGEVSAGRTVTIGGLRPVVTGANVSLERLELTLARNASVDLAVEFVDPSALAGPDGRRVVAGLSVIHDVPDSAVTNATLTLAVPTDRLGGRNATLYRHAGGWTPLPTNATRGANRTRIRARSPGLSQFALVVDPGGPRDAGNGTGDGTATNRTEDATNRTGTTSVASPDVRVTAATLNRTTVPVGGAVTVDATLRNAGNASGTYTAGLVVSGRVVATERATVAPNATARVTMTYRPERAGNYTPSVNGTATGPLRVVATDGASDSGGGTAGVLGFLPLGLLRTLVTYVGGVAVAAYLGLKGVALYLGY